MKENENVNVNEEVTTGGNVADNNAAIVDQSTFADGNATIDLSKLSPSEQKEIVQDILQTEAELEAMALPQYNSSDILNRPINVLDASFRQIKDGDRMKAGVSFVCEFAEGDEQVGEQFTVLKSSNPFNDVYVVRFDKMRGIISKPLNGYEFIEESRFTKNGNAAHVLRRISLALGAGKSK